MSADIRTRRLIVTLPDVSGEEANIAIDEIKTYLGDTAVVGYRVDHALGESLPEGISVRPNMAWQNLVVIEDRDQGIRLDISPAAARQIAGSLLHAADAVEHAVAAVAEAHS